VLARAIGDRLRADCVREGILVPRLVFEPGRAVVGSAGITLYRVGSVKERNGTNRMLAVDGGMSDNPRPMLYGASYEVVPAAPRNGAPLVATTVVGQHCESGDVVAEGLSLPADVGAGDVLAMAGTGAYCYSLASNYNRTPRPAVVAVDDGEAELWLRSETYEDLERLEVR
jgi:diaminopimelate decarboxylase